LMYSGMAIHTHSSCGVWSVSILHSELHKGFGLPV